jgi:DNA polymerase-4
VSKIASDLEKPNGLVVVEPGEERRFLAPLPAKKLSGIGPKTQQRLAAEGIKTLGQLAKRTDEWAQRMFGKWGPEMVALSRGEDNRPVATEGKGKSVSAETTFSRDISDRDEIADCVARLSSGVARRLGRSAAMGRTVTVKLRLSDFTTFTRSVTLASPVNDVATIREMAQRLVSKELLPGRRFRLVGVGVSNFGEVRQLSLFDETKTSLR